MPRRPKTVTDFNDLRLERIGRVLQAWRQRAGLTQRAVADELGYTTAQFVSNWERGAAMPPIPVLPRLAEIYSVAPATVVDVFHGYEREVVQLELEALRKLLTGRGR